MTPMLGFVGLCKGSRFTGKRFRGGEKCRRNRVTSGEEDMWSAGTVLTLGDHGIRSNGGSGWRGD